MQQPCKTTTQETLLARKENLYFSLFPFKYLMVNSVLIKITGITALLHPGQAPWLQDWQQPGVPTAHPIHFDQV